MADTLFDAFMYPFEAVTLSRRRRKLISRASGRVLEIGAGTGANLPFYQWGELESLHLSDLKLSDNVRGFSNINGCVVHRLEASAEKLPFSSHSFDTVVSTLAFCSVERPTRGYEEILRVLRPGGRLLFIEHVSPPRRTLRWLADFADPFWHALNRSCHLNRNTLDLIRSSGFRIATVHSGIGGILISGVVRKPLT